MKATFLKTSFIVTTLVLFFAVSAMALPVAGNNVKFTLSEFGGTNSGGEFYAEVKDGDTFIDTYITFCLEKQVAFTLGSTYIIESVADAVTGKDPIKDETKWVFWNYLNGTFGDRSKETAAAVQWIVWYLENEVNNLGSYLGTYDTWFAGVSDYSINGTVKVLNIVDANNNYAQSQLVGAPVPEPTTLLLFGTGLLGLAGIARRRRNS